jgi:phenylpyruvate tautomerase PptA (4-oxalocrotonate tautomerase family)
MPLVTIDVGPARTGEVARAIADGVHDALVAAIAIPDGDRFQIINRHAAGELVFDPDYLGIDRRDVVFVRITLVEGRSNERKKELYRTIVANLEAVGVRREDVVISLTETGRIDWSIGNGVAQLVEASPAST